MERWEEHFAETLFRRSGDTAHDLKTPLNIGVLNLELLRMRSRKLDQNGTEDEKLEAYARAIDTELRRLASIFDAFFVYSVPPRGEEGPKLVDAVAPLSGAGTRVGIAMPEEGPAMVYAHASRIDALSKMFFDGISRLVVSGKAEVSFSRTNGSIVLRVEGPLSHENDELGKVFKFYYTDPAGAPELSLAVARLIAETYGGTITADQPEGNAVVELTLPVEER